MRFYICRHGQSTFNVLKKIQGHTNISVLTDIGRNQALESAQKLKDKNIDIIISSPLMRAYETAEIFKTILKKEIITDGAFIEINVGDVEGLDKNKINTKYKETYEYWKSNDPKHLDVSFPGGETKRQARERIFKGLLKYTNMDYENIVITAHGIALAQVLLDLGENFTEIPNAAIICIEYKDSKFKYIKFV